VVLGYGNPSRGDDALGPAVIARLEAERERRPDWREIELLTDFQLQIEHALDLEGRALALFVDATVSGDGPYGFQTVQAAADTSYTSHALSPAAVLEVYAQTTGRAPPPAFVLSVRGYRFELGEPISVAAERNLRAATAFAIGLCERRRVAHWEGLATPGPAPWQV
jgi:hydrogenase maturation protease